MLKFRRMGSTPPREGYTLLWDQMSTKMYLGVDGEVYVKNEYANKEPNMAVRREATAVRDVGLIKLIREISTNEPSGVHLIYEIIAEEGKSFTKAELINNIINGVYENNSDEEDLSEYEMDEIEIKEFKSGLEEAQKESIRREEEREREFQKVRSQESKESLSVNDEDLFGPPKEEDNSMEIEEPVKVKAECVDIFEETRPPIKPYVARDLVQPPIPTEEVRNEQIPYEDKVENIEEPCINLDFEEFLEKYEEILNKLSEGTEDKLDNLNKEGLEAIADAKDEICGELREIPPTVHNSVISGVGKNIDNLLGYLEQSYLKELLNNQEQILNLLSENKNVEFDEESIKSLLQDSVKSSMKEILDEEEQLKNQKYNTEEDIENDDLVKDDLDTFELNPLSVEDVMKISSYKASNDLKTYIQKIVLESSPINYDIYEEIEGIYSLKQCEELTKNLLSGKELKRFLHFMYLHFPFVFVEYMELTNERG